MDRRAFIRAAGAATAAALSGCLAYQVEKTSEAKARTNRIDERQSEVTAQEDRSQTLEGDLQQANRPAELRTELVLDRSGGGMATPKLVTPSEKERVEEVRRREREEREDVQPEPGAIMIDDDGHTRIFGPDADYRTFEEVSGTNLFEES